MRVVVVGATGNVGTSVLRSLVDEPEVTEILGIARRLPGMQWPKTSFVEADIVSDDLVPHFQGADAVIHLAWLIQPSRDEEQLHAVNVDGSGRVFRAAGEAGVGALVYASSIGAYSPGPKDRGVDESWPTDGIDTSFYSRHKAATERQLDQIETDFPGMRVVRLRKGLVFKREAAAEIRRYFIGPLLPGSLMRPQLIPVVPDIEGLVVQAVHSYDAGEAYRLAVVRDVRGAFNIAADPVIDPDMLAELFGAKKVSIPPAAVRAAADASWQAHAQPTPPGWVDLALNVPIMDTTRARDVLGWEAKHSSGEALMDLLNGLRDGSGADTPPLAPESSGPGRVREFMTGVGSRNPTD
ncbi:MAG TPA: NAD-dependent epimerase/dehydratase family protein [Thermoleophilaceae bacterium]|jgi:nucleoside-diphosphate-sugar epimerase